MSAPASAAHPLPAAPARARWLAAGLAAAALALLAPLADAPGVSRDEAAVLAGEALAPPGAARAAAVAGQVGRPLGLGALRAARLPSAAAGAGAVLLLALLGGALAGTAGALLAPALFLAVPRALHALIVATPDAAAAFLWLLSFAAHRASLGGARRALRLGAGALAGAAFGAAVAVRIDAWAILPLLAGHGLLARRLARRARARGAGAGELSSDAGAPVPGERGAERAGDVGRASSRAGSPGWLVLRRLRPAAMSVGAMVTIGPAVLVALWPALARDPAAAIGGAHAALRAPEPWPHLGALAGLSGAAPPLAPLAALAFALPAAVLAACAGGVLHACGRLARGAAGRDPEVRPADEVLLLAGALGPLALAAAGLAPAAPGLRPVLPALPFLALLGARALATAARLAVPSLRHGALAAAALAALWPALRTAAHHLPHGTSAWSALTGGLPAAATRGLARQDGGDALSAALPEVNQRARAGARVLLAGQTPAQVASLRATGRLRADLALAEGPADADVAVFPVGLPSRDLEYQVWSAFRSARPVAGAFQDEVPLALVYARPGAWR